MDHFPAVRNPYDPIVIPHLGGSNYDGNNFVGYPASHDWDVVLLKDGSLQGHTKLEAAQFLQTWLHFGIIHETLSAVEKASSLPLSDFVRTDEHTKQIFSSTATLPRHLKDLYGQLKVLPETTTKGCYPRFRRCMMLACSTWRALMRMSPDDGNPEK